MPEYYLVWEIEIEADSPQEAARLALEIQRDPTSLATVFDVTDPKTGTTTQVDLSPEEGADA